MVFRTSLLRPGLNYPLDINIVTKVQWQETDGNVGTSLTRRTTQAVWVDLGLKSFRTKKGGRRIAQLVEVHLKPDFSDLRPGIDFFELNGEQYRIVNRLEMSRMTGSVMYEATKRDE